MINVSKHTSYQNGALSKERFDKIFKKDSCWMCGKPDSVIINNKYCSKECLKIADKRKQSAGDKF